MKSNKASDDTYQFTEVDGVSARVYCQNLDCKETPLLLLNGLGQSIEVLLPLIGAFGDRPIIAFDAVGVGKSSVPEDDFSIRNHAAFVASMLDELGVQEVDALGISWGGAVAQQFAHSFPNKCRKLILAITSTGGVLNWWGTPIGLMEIQFPMRLVDRNYGNMVGPWMYGGEALLEPGLFKEYSKNAIRPSYKGYSAQVRAMCNWSSLGWAHRIKQQTLVISGLFDALIPAPNQVALAALIPNSRLLNYRSGHLLMYSRRHEVAQHISEFLA